MFAELKSWLINKNDEIRDELIYQVPNMLPDGESIDALLAIMIRAVGESPQVQLSNIQSWALLNIGTDIAVANDWLTLIKSLKDIMLRFLEKEFDTGALLIMWRELDNIFNYTLIETTKLSSDLDRSILLAHMVDLRREMDKLNRNKSDFVAVAAHELRTPLTLLEGYASMMRLQIPKELKALEMYLDGFDTGILRLRDIINDMLDVTMLEAKTFTIRYQPIRIDHIIDMVCQDLKEAFVQRGVSLELVKPFAYEKTMYGDPERLFQAINKVISNALKYTPDGGVVTVRTELSPYFGEESGVDGYIRIDVVDTGIGISEENLESIFEKFSGVGNVALHSTSKTNFKGGGPGLGLPIARGIIDVHQGRIWAESPGCDEKKCPGSSFHIELPIYVKPPKDSDQAILVG